MATGEKTLRLEQKLLDAAEQCFQQYGVQKTTIGDICDMAQVSRTSVYRCFKNREAVLEAVMLRDASRIFRDMLAHISRFEKTEDRIVEALAFIMEVVEKTPRLTAILANDAAVQIASSGSVYERMALFTEPLFDKSHFEDLGKLRKDVSPNDVKEYLTQTLYGLLTVKTVSTKTPKARRSYIRKFIVPALLA